MGEKVGEKADLKRCRRDYRQKLRSLNMELAGDEEARSAASAGVKSTWDQIIAIRRVTIEKLEEYLADIEEHLAALRKDSKSSDVTGPQSARGRRYGSSRPPDPNPD